jgi:hypothetical protein
VSQKKYLSSKNILLVAKVLKKVNLESFEKSACPFLKDEILFIQPGRI